jgi:hypothetical protein
VLPAASVTPCHLASAVAPEIAEPQVPTGPEIRSGMIPRRLGVSESAMTYVDQYHAGTCNIGPAEIARRRMVGHVGLIVTVLLGVLLVWADAPGWARLVLFVPAAVGAAGYIQAWLRFCADYGWRGVFNFGEAGHDRTTSVADEAARSADRRKALLIGAGSAAAGVLAVLVFLPF